MLYGIEVFQGIKTVVIFDIKNVAWLISCYFPSNLVKQGMEQCNISVVINKSAGDRLEASISWTPQSELPGAGITHT